MHVTDEVTTHGSGESERFYIKATCTIWAYGFPGAVIKSCCEVREDDSKKGMDGCQISGSRLFIRKQVLHGLDVPVRRLQKTLTAMRHTRPEKRHAWKP